MDKSSFDHRLSALAKKYRDEFGDLLEYDIHTEIHNFDGHRETLKPYIVDSVDMVCKAQEAGDKILVEAANALCLDIGKASHH